MTTKTFRSRDFIPDEEIGKVFAEHNAAFPKHLRKKAMSLSYGEAKKMYLKGTWSTWGKCFMVRLSKNYQGNLKKL